MSCRRPVLALAAALALLGAAAPAQAAKTCAEPAAGAWERATPEEAGMDAARLQEALDHGTANLGFSVRVFRRGCLVGEDRGAGVNRNQQFQSWSLAKSVTAMVFGRAMTLGLIQPDDVVGGLVPEADAAHGEITMRDLLTMTSGLRWNGFRDYNVFTMPDRVRDALTLEPVKPHGTYFEYAQSAVSLLAHAVERAAGEDFEVFAQRELMDPIGIPDEAWYWERDKQGHVLGFMGVNMRPDDYGRLGELMRRGGVWKGTRVLSRRFMREALAPSATNGCYGWLIWLNAAKPCIGPTIAERPYADQRQFPDLPADLYRFSGLFGQLVSVFPTQELVVVRTGQDPGLAGGFTGGGNWEHDLYALVLAAITDTEVEPPGDAEGVPAAQEANADYGFQTALLEPDQYSAGASPPELPPAGPARARALWVRPALARPDKRGRVALRATCPARRPQPAIEWCTGKLAIEGGRRARRYRLAPGETRRIKLRLRRKTRRALPTWLTVTARNADAAGTVATVVDWRFRARRAR